MCLQHPSILSMEGTNLMLCKYKKIMPNLNAIFLLWETSFPGVFKPNKKHSAVLCPTPESLAYVESVSVGSEERDFWCFALLPFPVFDSRPTYRTGKTPIIPFLAQSFFAPQPYGNAYYAGYLIPPSGTGIFMEEPAVNPAGTENWRALGTRLNCNCFPALFTRPLCRKGGFWGRRMWIFFERFWNIYFFTGKEHVRYLIFQVKRRCHNWRIKTLGDSFAGLGKLLTCPAGLPVIQADSRSSAKSWLYDQLQFRRNFVAAQLS